MNIIKLENLYQLPTYHKLPLVITHGKGPYVWSDKGEKYLDFYGGHAVALIGHCHPKIVSAVSKQMKKLIFYSNVVYNDQRAKAAEKLAGLAPGIYSSVFFCNSGTEANETALKLAKKFTGKDEVISFIGSFHGRTIGSLSVTGNDKYKKYAGSVLPNVKFAEFGNIESVKKLISKDTATVILEPIQSLAGINEADPKFYTQLKKLTQEKGIILIFDEVQTGLGRTGKMFYGQHHGIWPDIVTLAKGIAGGLPAGVVLINKKIAQSVEMGDQGSTFGGGPVICSAILATLKVIKKEKLVQNAAKLGKLLKKNIKILPKILQVTGKGLLLGIKVEISAKELQEKLLQHNIITGTSDNPNILRIIPPLTISEKEVKFFILVLSHVLKEF